MSRIVSSIRNMLDQQTIRDQLKSGPDEEFDFDCDVASINAIAEGETHVEIGHFVVQKKDRRKGYGSLIFDTMIDVLQEEGYSSATVRIQAIDDGSDQDPVMEFLQNYDFRHNRSYEDPKWGTCVEAFGHF